MYIVGKEFAFVISTEKGHGWATQYQPKDIKRIMTTDTRIVERILSRQPVTYDFLQDVIPGNEIAFPEDREPALKVVWLRLGQEYGVTDTDGKERVVRAGKGAAWSSSMRPVLQ